MLKGTVPFLADLVRAIPPDVPVEVDFLAITPYAPATGRVRIVKDLDLDIGGRDVVLVEDLVDTGLTLAYLTKELMLRAPRRLEVCALLDKPARRLVPVDLDLVGFEIGDRFVVGYGLDHSERFRDLRDVVAIDPVRDGAGDSAIVTALYPRRRDRLAP